jgi:hypothetical protein
MRLSSEEESVDGLFSLYLTCLRSLPLSVVNKDVLAPAFQLSAEAVKSCPQASVSRSVVSFFEQLHLLCPPHLLPQVSELIVICSQELGTAVAEMIFESGVNNNNDSSSPSSATATTPFSSIVQSNRRFSRGSEGSELLCALLRANPQLSSESLCSGVLNAVELIANRSLHALSMQFPSALMVLQSAQASGAAPVLALINGGEKDVEETGLLSLSRAERRNVVFKAFELITGSSRASAMLSNVNAGGSPQGRMGPSPRQGMQLLADVTKLCRGLLQRGALSDWNALY